MQSKNGSSEVPHKTSPTTPKSSRATNTTRSGFDSANSKLTPTNSSTERSPKVLDSRSPKSPVIEKKRPIGSSELHSEVARLEDELKKTKEQLSSSESSTQHLQQETDEINKQLAAKSAKFDESQSQLAALSSVEDGRLEALRRRRPADSGALASAVNEIRRLEQQLDVMKSESAQAESSETAISELETLKEEVEETLSSIEGLKIQNRERGSAEAAAKFSVLETQKQLEIAKASIDALRAGGRDLMESLSSVTSELEQSEVRADALEEIATEYRAATENEEQIRMGIQIWSAFEAAELVKVDAGTRESELKSAIERAKTELSELKERFFDVENEVQMISAMHGGLKEEMKKEEANQFDCELKLMEAATEVTELKAKLLDRETALQSILEQNERLSSELRKRESEHRRKYEAAVDEAEKARAGEKEALRRMVLVEGEAEKSGERAMEVLEQAKEANSANSEMEAEIKKLKVQADQWRKAAEAASAILAAANNGGRVIEMSSPLSGDLDDESPKKKKNNSVMRKLGGLWRKSFK